MKPSIETLPVEILHHIFDNLDTETILFSIRPVCRSFQAVVNTYDRFNWDFKSISQSKCHLLCRLINPKNVTSLRLCENEQTANQISTFLSLVRLRQLTRLHSIRLIGIKEFELNMILKSIKLDNLTSFSLHIQEHDDRRKQKTLRFLSSILAQYKLRRVELKIKYNRLWDISWPLNSRIKYLIIDSDINISRIITILSGSPELHTLILKANLPNSFNSMKNTCSFPQLTSLTIENLDGKLDQLESFLLLVPSLEYLKLIGLQDEFDGGRLEQFIQLNLPCLNNFEFFIDVRTATLPQGEGLQSKIECFRSLFWTEYKKWLVGARFNPNRYLGIQIYSIPICKSVFKYELNVSDTGLSNSKIFAFNDPYVNKNIKELTLSTKPFISQNMKNEEVCYSEYFIEI